MAQVHEFPVEAAALGDSDFLGVDVSLGVNIWQTQKYKGAKLVKRGNTLFVDQVNGSDTTGVRGRADLPFLTLSAAKTAAQIFDTIIVRPGTYSSSNNLFKTGVDWYFMPNTYVEYTGSANGAIFDDGPNGTNSNVSCNIYGRGTFSSDATATGNHILNLAQINSKVYFESDNLLLGTNAANKALNVTNGTLVVRTRGITADINLAAANTANVYIVSDTISCNITVSTAVTVAAIVAKTISGGSVTLSNGQVVLDVLTDLQPAVTVSGSANLNHTICCGRLNNGLTVSGGQVTLRAETVSNVSNTGGILYLATPSTMGALTVGASSIATQVQCAGAGVVTLAKDTAFISTGNITSLTVTGSTCNVTCFDIGGAVSVTGPGAGSAVLNLYFNNIFGTLTVDGGATTATAKVFGNFVNRLVSTGAATLIADIDSASSVYANAGGTYTLIKSARITNATQGGTGIGAPVEINGSNTVRLQDCVLISSGTPAFTVHGATGGDIVKFYGGTVGNFTTNNVLVTVGALTVDTDVD